MYRKARMGITEDERRDNDLKYTINIWHQRNSALLCPASMATADRRGAVHSNSATSNNDAIAFR